jgi:uncharacterized integral membrane protein
MSQEPTARQPEARRQVSLGAIASGTGLGALLVFVFQNREDVRVDFLFLHFTWPLWLYTIVVAVFGAMVWLGMGILRRHRRRVARREARRDFD